MLDVTSARGMRDFLPEEARLREQLRRRIIDGYARAGYHLITTPAIENLTVLDRKTSSENSKLMFRILKRGKKLAAALATDKQICDLGLRYDLTVPLVRYYINHHGKLPACGGSFKSLNIGEVWRAERPQKGRYRQFVQCDTDIFGCASPLAELELIVEGIKRLQEILATPLIVHLNDRRILADLLASSGFDETDHEPAFVLLDKQDKIGFAAVTEELINVYGEEKTSQLVTKLANLEEDFAQLCKKENPAAPTPSLRLLSNLITALRVAGLKNCQFKFNPYLARGIEYYTGTIVEVKTADNQQTIAAGGRYDNLVSSLGGPPVAACGFSLGFERIVDRYYAEESKLAGTENQSSVAVLVPADADLSKLVAKLNAELKSNYCLYLLKPNSLGKQLTSLTEQGYHQCLRYQVVSNSFFTHQLQ